MKTLRPINMPVMPKMCPTCPFGPNGCIELREKISSRVLSVASQTCHSTGVAIGKNYDTHLCRGARNLQLTVFHRLGVIAEPTDEAWMKAARQLL